MTPSCRTADLAALGTTCRVLLDASRGTDAAFRVLGHRTRELDEAASRFRPDSELSRLHRAARAGTVTTRLSPLLGDVLETALHVAALTGGLVDPTVGADLMRAGYDADLRVVQSRVGHPDATVAPSRTGWTTLRYDRTTRTLTVPRGVVLDVGASGKALLADRLAAELADRLCCGVLVDLGGDLAVAGAVPEQGWRVGVLTDSGVTQTVVSAGQAFATSSTTRRVWRAGGRVRHHIIDPRTGSVAPAYWRQVTVAAGCAVEANAASTAAIVLGADAVGWLRHHGLPALLLRHDGTAIRTAGWPLSTEGAA